MRTSRHGVAFVAAAEGIVTKAYRDSAGVWTIGVGHTAAAGAPRPVKGMTITRDRALAILAADLPKYEAGVHRAFGKDTPQTVYDGAVSFHFNTGSIAKASWVRTWLTSNMKLARTQLGYWTKAGGRTVQGLVNRRKAEAKLIFDGDYGKAAEALIAGGFDAGIAPSVGDGDAPAGTYVAKLAELGFKGRTAVIDFQKSHADLHADGILGPATRAAIDRDLAARDKSGIGVIGGGAVLVAEAGAQFAGLPGWIVPVAIVAAVVLAAVLIASHFGVFAGKKKG